MTICLEDKEGGFGLLTESKTLQVPSLINWSGCFFCNFLTVVGLFDPTNEACEDVVDAINQNL